jgi:hypothetical protein
MKRVHLINGACMGLVLSASMLYGQTDRPAARVPQDRPVVRDQREDVRDRREDVRDRRENVRDRREDVRDAQRDGGVLDRREDVRDRREDVRDRREDVRDRIEDQIDRNPRLATRVRMLLPPNRVLADAASGFRTRGQFIAALHVSRNLNIPFDDLKARMTGEQPMPLGQAIRELRTDLTEQAAAEEARKAEEQALQTERDAQATD